MTEGQIEWAPLDDAYDRVAVGYGKNLRCYDVFKGGKASWKPKLMEQFPGEERAIDEYFRLTAAYSEFFWLLLFVKFAPQWIVQMMIKSGRPDIFLAREKTKLFSYGANWQLWNSLRVSLF